MEGLSPRQVEILTLAARGMTYKEIGAALGLAGDTVKYHLRQISERLHLETRAQMVVFAQRAGLMPPVGDTGQPPGTADLGPEH